jgi:hypothetical protein
MADTAEAQTLDPLAPVTDVIGSDPSDVAEQMVRVELGS